MNCKWRFYFLPLFPPSTYVPSWNQCAGFFSFYVVGWLDYKSWQKLVYSSAWIPNTDLTPLDPESCKDVNEKGKAKSLVEAYRVASENHDLQYFKDMLADHQRALEQDQEEREAREAAKTAKQDKKKRKSMDAADEQEDDATDAGAEKRKSTKKRKKDVESDVESDKVSGFPEFSWSCDSRSRTFGRHFLGWCFGERTIG